MLSKIRQKSVARKLSKASGASLLVVSLLGCLAYGRQANSQAMVLPPDAVSTPSKTSVPKETPDIEVDPASLLPDLPPLPPRKASLIGGTIRKVDRVRDQIIVQVFGGGKMKIMFDPRTQILQAGAKASAPDLHPGDRVYIDTILDGSTVFARNIRLAGVASGGNSQGVVKSYSAEKGELVLQDVLSPNPVKLHITARTQVMQGDHAASASQLIPGTLVNVNFATHKEGRDAQQISILAVPGTDFTFGGEVLSLDLHLNLLVLLSSSDHKTYEIYLDPAMVSVDDRLRAGADVTTTAKFDGTRYVARDLIVNFK